MEALVTPRMILEPMTLELVEAVFRGDRAALEEIAGAKIPAAWPGRVLVERAFSASLEAIRADPETRLWGDRLMITRTNRDVAGGDAERLVIGSIIFHGKPDGSGVVEVGYGVEESWQGKGVATEGTRAVVEWALEQPGVLVVAATTPPWHAASVRVLEKSGLVRVGTEEHETLGEVLRFERRR